MIQKKYISTILFLTLITFGCGKQDSENTNRSGTISQTKTPIKLNPLNLGEAAPFAVLAYASISSNSNSIINGKVGLKPGTHDMINLDPSEVRGGAIDIMGSDDDTIPLNLLSIAKVDMVGAYTKAASLIPDSDKIGIFEGIINGKKLEPGVYKWNQGLSITEDFTLSGKSNDVWIFKIPGHLKISSGVHMILNGGASAKNVFWQVAGSAIIESNSEIGGTIIAQQFIDLKDHVILTGRAFAKNGYVNLSHTTINIP